MAEELCTHVTNDAAVVTRTPPRQRVLHNHNRKTAAKTTTAVYGWARGGHTHDGKRCNILIGSARAAAVVRCRCWRRWCAAALLVARVPRQYAASRSPLGGLLPVASRPQDPGERCHPAAARRQPRQAEVLTACRRWRRIDASHTQHCAMMRFYLK